MSKCSTAMKAGFVVISLTLAAGTAIAQMGVGGPPAASDQGQGAGPGSDYGPGMMSGGGYGPGPLGWRGGRGYGPGMMDGYGSGMMGWMFGPGDDGAGIGHIEGRLAFVKAELKVTPQQEPLWDRFADTIRANAKTIGTRRAPFFARGYWREPLPQRLEQQEQAMSAHLDALRQAAAAIKPLYDALDEGQRKTADSLLGTPMMGALGVM